MAAQKIFEKKGSNEIILMKGKQEIKK